MDQIRSASMYIASTRLIGRTQGSENREMRLARRLSFCSRLPAEFTARHGLGTATCVAGAVQGTPACCPDHPF